MDTSAGGLDALNDCLLGRWGAAPPFSLIWHASEVARGCLGVTPHAVHRPPAFDELLAYLAEGDRVAVHLA